MPYSGSSNWTVPTCPAKLDISRSHFNSLPDQFNTTILTVDYMAHYLTAIICYICSKAMQSTKRYKEDIETGQSACDSPQRSAEFERLEVSLSAPLQWNRQSLNQCHQTLCVVLHHWEYDRPAAHLEKSQHRRQYLDVSLWPAECTWIQIRCNAANEPSFKTHHKTTMLSRSRSSNLLQGSICRNSQSLIWILNHS